MRGTVAMDRTREGSRSHGRGWHHQCTVGFMGASRQMSFLYYGCLEYYVFRSMYDSMYGPVYVKHVLLSVTHIMTIQSKKTSQFGVCWRTWHPMRLFHYVTLGERAVGVRQSGFCVNRALIKNQLNQRSIYRGEHHQQQKPPTPTTTHSPPH